MTSRVLRGVGTIALLPIFGLVFWAAATVASSLPGLFAVAVNVHGLGLVSYAGDTLHRPAPLSLQVLEDAQRDASKGSVPLAVSAPTLPLSTPTVLPVATPTKIPATLPTPTPAPWPTPTAAPSLLPLPLPVPVPIQPSVLPGLLK